MNPSNITITRIGGATITMTAGEFKAFYDRGINGIGDIAQKSEVTNFLNAGGSAINTRETTDLQVLDAKQASELNAFVAKQADERNALINKESAGSGTHSGAVPGAGTETPAERNARLQREVATNEQPVTRVYPGV